jgi:pyruvate kinase
MATSDGRTINLNSKEVPRLVKPNDVLYLDDGKIILLVQDCDIVILRYSYTVLG